jgi:hypothetical protein
VPKSDLAPHFDNVFLLETSGFIVAFLADPRVKDNLDDPTNIAEVNEKQTSMIAESIHPAHEEDILPRIRRRQISTVDSLSPLHKKTFTRGSDH